MNPQMVLAVPSFILQSETECQLGKMVSLHSSQVASLYHANYTCNYQLFSDVRSSLVVRCTEPPQWSHKARLPYYQQLGYRPNVTTIIKRCSCSCNFSRNMSVPKRILIISRVSTFIQFQVLFLTEIKSYICHNSFPTSFYFYFFTKFSCNI
jgi:hypothetical protein